MVPSLCVDEKCGDPPALRKDEQHGISSVSHPGTRGLIWERDDCSCVEVCVSVRTAAGECVCVTVCWCMSVYVFVDKMVLYLGEDTCVVK